MMSLVKEMRELDYLPLCDRKHQDLHEDEGEGAPQYEPDLFAPENNDLMGQYQGEMVKKKKHGIGRLTWANNDSYYGDWKNDKKDGYGFMMWCNGDSYEGTWKEDRRHGVNAKYTYNNGGVFIGTYRHDVRHGAGKFIWPDGDMFVGTWFEGGRNGRGILIKKDGTRQEQDWEEVNPNYAYTLPPKLPHLVHLDLWGSS